MKKLIGYVRVSTDEQGRNKNGLEAQTEAIERFALLNGYELIDIVEEVASGKLGLEDRPVLASVITRARKERAVVVVNKLDRLARKALIVMTLIHEKVKFIVTELGEDVDPFMLHIYAVVAEKEREMISERTKAALAQLKLKGVKLGNPTNRDEAAEKGRTAQAEKADAFAQRLKPTIQRMRDKKMTLREMADELNATGVKTARGGVWAASTVNNLIARF